MPATPFHFGPGLLLKAVAPRQFSVAAYSVAQVVIDVESGYHLIRGDYPVHRQAHTFFLGGLIGLLCGLIVWRVGRWLAKPRDIIPEALGAEYRMPIAVASGVFGGVFHSVLDGIMHPDVRPFMPWSDSNPFLRLVGLAPLHLACVAAALFGVVCLTGWRRRGSP